MLLLLKNYYYYYYYYYGRGWGRLYHKLNRQDLIASGSTYMIFCISQSSHQSVRAIRWKATPTHLLNWTCHWQFRQSHSHHTPMLPYSSKVKSRFRRFFTSGNLANNSILLLTVLHWLNLDLLPPFFFLKFFKIQQIVIVIIITKINFVYETTFKM